MLQLRERMHQQEVTAGRQNKKIKAKKRRKKKKKEKMCVSMQCVCLCMSEQHKVEVMET